MSNKEKLEITAEAAAECAKICEIFAAEVRTLERTVAASSRVGGFGALPSGQALAKKYTDLTTGPTGSLTAMLQGHIDVATKLAETFTQMGENYTDTDEATAASLTHRPPA